MTNEEAGAAFCAYVEGKLKDGAAGDISEETLREVISAAVRAYAAKVEHSEQEFPIIDTARVSTTEGVVAACALIRAIDLNMFDVALWFNRPGAGR